jgi:hypothetical protein
MGSPNLMICEIEFLFAVTIVMNNTNIYALNLTNRNQYIQS